MPITVNIEIIDEQPSWNNEASTEKLRPVGAGEPRRDVEQSTPDVGTGDVSGNQSEEAPRASEDAAGRGVEEAGE